MRRLTVRPPIDIGRRPPVTRGDRRLENKGFLVACGDRDGLIGDLAEGHLGWPAVAGGDLRWPAMTGDHIKEKVGSAIFPQGSCQYLWD